MRWASLVALTLAACSQPAPVKPAPHVVGTWRGTSTCLVQPSACHDEQVVYRISDALHVTANKIVDGQEQAMGEIDCTFDAPTLRCPIEKGVFSFEIDGDAMHGKLELTDGTRFRTIEAHRVR